MKRKNRGISIGVTLLLLLIAILSIWLFPDEAPTHGWSGQWEVSYFYSNAPQLVYSGTLDISGVDSLSAKLEIFPPAGRRAEPVDIRIIETADQAGLLQFELLHTAYKIDGGHLREAVKLEMEPTGSEATPSFSGTGRCVDHCAEGTESASVHWRGTLITPS
ncbi:MAG: hypothetical protein AAFO94_09105 [Bacteroidota bacterium]